MTPVYKLFLDEIFFDGQNKHLLLLILHAKYTNGTLYNILPQHFTAYKLHAVDTTDTQIILLSYLLLHSKQTGLTYFHAKYNNKWPHAHIRQSTQLLHKHKGSVWNLIVTNKIYKTKQVTIVLLILCEQILDTLIDNKFNIMIFEMYNVQSTICHG